MLLSTGVRIGLLFVCSVAVATPAFARRVMIADSGPTLFQTYPTQLIAPSWAREASNPRPLEYPSIDVLSSELGIDEGKVELFHYGLENAPSKATVLSGVVDGDGIRLKVSW